MINQIVNYCSDILYNFPIAEKALNYLNDRLAKDIQQTFQFGYFPDHKNLNVFDSFLHKDELIKYNLYYEKNGHEGCLSQKVICGAFEHHNLLLPYKDAYGNIIALVGRSILTDKERENQCISKYKNTSFEKSKHLFGLFEATNSILAKNYVYICEGQFDVIQAHAHQLSNVVALGSSNMSFDQVALILRYTNNLRLFLDNDEAGDLGRERIIQKFGKYANISNYYIPNGFKDLDEFLVESSHLSVLEIENALLH